ncbi:MAG: hypothetical protein KJO98_11725 [Rhodothermia bacterium]|nr:hypothetical protein [Rhodothermia bacterium]
MTTPFDDRAFSSWSQLIAGAILFGVMFEAPIILFDFVAEGRLFLSRAALLMGVGGFLGYLCTAAAIKRFGAASD